MSDYSNEDDDSVMNSNYRNMDFYIPRIGVLVDEDVAYPEPVFVKVEVTVEEQIKTHTFECYRDLRQLKTEVLEHFKLPGTIKDYAVYRRIGDEETRLVDKDDSDVEDLNLFEEDGITTVFKYVGENDMHKAENIGK